MVILLLLAFTRFTVSASASDCSVADPWTAPVISPGSSITQCLPGCLAQLTEHDRYQVSTEYTRGSYLETGANEGKYAFVTVLSSPESEAVDGATLQNSQALNFSLICAASLITHGGPRWWAGPGYDANSLILYVSPTDPNLSQCCFGDLCAYALIVGISFSVIPGGYHDNYGQCEDAIRSYMITDYSAVELLPNSTVKAVYTGPATIRFVLRVSVEDFKLHGPFITISVLNASAVYVTWGANMLPGPSNYTWVSELNLLSQVATVRISPADLKACLPGVTSNTCEYWVGVVPSGELPNVNLTSTVSVTTRLQQYEDNNFGLPWFTSGSEDDTIVKSVSRYFAAAVFIVNIVLAVVGAWRAKLLTFSGVFQFWKTNVIVFYACEAVTIILVLYEFIQLCAQFSYFIQNNFVAYINPQYRGSEWLSPLQSVTDMEMSKYVWLGPEYGRLLYGRDSSSFGDVPHCVFNSTLVQANPCLTTGVSSGALSYVLSDNLMDGTGTQVVVGLGLVITLFLKVVVLWVSRTSPPKVPQTSGRSAGKEQNSVGCGARVKSLAISLEKWAIAWLRSMVLVVIGFQQFCVLLPLYAINANPFCVVMQGRNLIGGICFYKIVTHIPIFALPIILAFTGAQFFQQKYRNPCVAALTEVLMRLLAIPAVAAFAAMVVYLGGGLVIGSVWACSNWLVAKFSVINTGMITLFALLRPFKDHVFHRHASDGATTRLAPITASRLN